MAERSRAQLAPRFGLFLGQAGQDWPQVRERFAAADELGFDHAYLVDHLEPTDPPYEQSMLEAWTLLAGLGVTTQRVRLGVLVTSNTFRHPALLAKQAVTVDHLSNGRLTLGIGTGWYGPEHRHFGLPFPGARDRVEALAEAAEILSRLQAERHVTFTGRHYSLHRARLDPGPLQRPRIPLLIAAHRPRTLAIAARFADIWDTFPPVRGAATEGVAEGVDRQVKRFAELCRAAGRDPVTIRRSTWTGADVLTTPEAYAAWVSAHAALGFTDFTTGAPADPNDRALRRIAAEVIPALRESADASR